MQQLSIRGFDKELERQIRHLSRAELLSFDRHFGDVDGLVWVDRLEPRSAGRP